MPLLCLKVSGIKYFLIHTPAFFLCHTSKCLLWKKACSENVMLFFLSHDWEINMFWIYNWRSYLRPQACCTSQDDRLDLRFDSGQITGALPIWGWSEHILLPVVWGVNRHNLLPLFRWSKTSLSPTQICPPNTHSHLAFVWNRNGYNGHSLPGPTTVHRFLLALASIDSDGNEKRDMLIWQDSDVEHDIPGERTESLFLYWR